MIKVVSLTLSLSPITTLIKLFIFIVHIFGLPLSRVTTKTNEYVERQNRKMYMYTQVRKIVLLQQVQLSITLISCHQFSSSNI